MKSHREALSWLFSSRRSTLCVQMETIKSGLTWRQSRSRYEEATRKSAGLFLSFSFTRSLCTTRLLFRSPTAVRHNSVRWRCWQQRCAIGWFLSCAAVRRFSLESDQRAGCSGSRVPRTIVPLSEGILPLVTSWANPVVRGPRNATVLSYWLLAIALQLPRVTVWRASIDESDLSLSLSLSSPRSKIHMTVVVNHAHSEFRISSLHRLPRCLCRRYLGARRKQHEWQTGA